MPSFITNAVQVQRFADALYNVAVGTTTMAQVTADITASGGLDNALNAYYRSSFDGVSTTTIAANMCTNLGIVAGSNGLVAADVTVAQNYIVGTLNAAAANARGAAVKGILNNLSALTNDKVFGAVATKFNSDIDKAAAYTGAADIVAGTVPAPVQVTAFSLTTGSDRLTGTSLDDTYDAGISSSSLQTLNSGDSIDGGAGTDTLQAIITGSVTPASLKSIENVNITNTTNASTIDFSNATGLQSVTNQASTVGLTISGVSKIVPITVRDTNIAAQVIAYNDVTGTSDAATITLANVTGAATLTVAGVEQLTFNSSGSSANTLASITTAQATNVTVVGTQSLTFTAALGSTITSLDASALVGATIATGVTAIMGSTGSNTITGSAGNDSFTVVSTGNDSITAGAGNDTIWYSTGTWTTSDTIDGGAGTDTIRLLATQIAAVSTTPTTYNTTNIETVQLTDALSNTTYTVANISAGATTLNVTGNTDNAGAAITVGTAISVTGSTIIGPAGTFTLGLGTGLTTNATNTGGRMSTGGTTTITDTGTGTTDTLNINNNARVTNGTFIDVFNGQVLNINGYENTTISTGTAAGLINNFGAITLTPDQSASTTLSFKGVNGVNAGGVITANVIDASAITAVGTGGTNTTAAFFMNNAPTATSVTGSGGMDVLIGNASTASSINGGAGNDTITGGSGNDTLIGGEGVDSIVSGAGNDSIDAGAGNDTINMAGNLAAGDTIDGGAGTDTLLSSVAIAATASGNIKNIEVIGFSGNVSQDMTAFLNAGVTTISSTSGAGAITISNAQTDFNTLIIAQTAAQPTLTRLVNGTNDTLNLLLQDGTADTTLTTPSLANEENITVGENGSDVTAAVTFALGTVTATQLKVLTITGSNNHTMTLSGNTALATINASAATGTLSITDGNSSVNETITGPASTGMTVAGGSGSDSITGGSAADSLTGGAGNDTINGQAGNDVIVNGAGTDVLTGGDGIDTLSQTGWTIGTTLDGGSTAVLGTVVNLGSSAVLSTVPAGHIGFTSTVRALNADITSVASNTAALLGTAATVSGRIDTLSGFENVVGSAGPDWIIGSSAANTLTPGAGSDLITTGSGADTIVEGQTDSITGTVSFAAATIANSDYITFGSGVDVVTDFSAANDFIDVTTAGTTYTTLIGLGSATALTVNTHYFVQGTYVNSTGVFTINSAATAATSGYATLLVADATAAAPSAQANYMVLIGVLASDLTTATFV